ncbi:alpha/beta fold hydrolase [Streptomyces sp. WMMB 322]|uniref:alpha/beta fold hydrolase n=1 Tax=Streptomyces sp. WMMB 322 TaxID=1286821 RepID=UPI000823A704|nr:alpha/beta hydrolase [Streptomyces sp. WMMB 322]SCK59226.1 Pimeloyl-ACP methyl ester carboxylesterase [Streptomyces sp. WMMB 322]
MAAVASPHAPVPVTESFVHVSPDGRPDFDLAYERRGSGEPVVLLHGIGHHWQAWEPVLSVLAASCEVIAVDLPGFGASPELPDGVSYELGSVIPLLNDAFTALGLERPHVVGNSLGGLLALELALHGHARSVTALSPAGFWKGWERRYAYAVLMGMRAGAKGIPDGMLQGIARSAAGRAALTSTIYARPGRRSPEAVVAETRSMRSATGFAPTLEVGRRPDVVFDQDIPGLPVTIGWGEKDRLLLRRQAARAKKAIPGARLVPLPGCGHVPMNDDPALVARLVLETVREA